MLIATEYEMRDLLNLLWLNTDKIRHIEIVNCPSRFGEPTESKISIQMMCQIKGKEDVPKQISTEFAKLMTEGEMKVRCN